MTCCRTALNIDDLYITRSQGTAKQFMVQKEYKSTENKKNKKYMRKAFDEIIKSKENKKSIWNIKK